METWKFFDITHRDHRICNPTSLRKLDEVIALIDLSPRPTVLDIACGKGEFLLRLAEAPAARSGGGFHGVGVDLSPFAIAELQDAARRRVPASKFDLHEMDGAEYRPDPGTFDLASCLGASWTFGGHRQTLVALRDAARPGGQVLVGEPFWRTEPAPEYLAWSGMTRDQFGTHASNVETGVEVGLTPLLALVSNGDEWDRYETLQWRATARYAAAHPDDPDVAYLLERTAHNRHEYLTWGRETLGWALYLFARPG